MLGGDLSTQPERSDPVGRVGSDVPARRRTRWNTGHIPGEVGIWVFILGDLLVFGVFFGVFMVERGQNLEEFRAGRESLSTAFGAINTLLLLTGSVLVVLAMRAVRDGPAGRAPALILGALATGALFVVNKGIEYGQKIDAGLTPGTNDFYTLFYVFTGIHLLHLLVGMAALAYMHALARRRRIGAREVATLEIGASYWHLVDLLWVVLFPLLYLVV